MYSKTVCDFATVDKADVIANVLSIEWMNVKWLIEWKTIKLLIDIIVKNYFSKY